MAVDVKSVKASSAKPPPLLKGRRGSQIPTELLNDMKARIEKGEWSTIDAAFDTKDKASSALVRFKKALGEIVEEGVELTGRVWGENTASASNGSEIYAAPFRFAVADKGKVQ